MVFIPYHPNWIIFASVAIDLKRCRSRRRCLTELKISLWKLMMECTSCCNLFEINLLYVRNNIESYVYVNKEINQLLTELVKSAGVGQSAECKRPEYER